MILEMTNCTNCAKYKLLLTWSTFHFRGSKRPSIFICAKAKTKTWLKIWLLTWIPQIKHSTLSLLNKRRSYTLCCQQYVKAALQNSHFHVSQQEVYPNKTNQLKPVRFLPDSKLSSYSFLSYSAAFWITPTTVCIVYFYLKRHIVFIFCPSTPQGNEWNIKS